MQIPKRFKMMGHTIEVKYEKDLNSKWGNTGEARYTEKSIVLQPFIEGFHERPISELEHVFFHELTHHILHNMGESDLCSNEKFVELFSGLLHQAISTMEYGTDDVNQRINFIQ